MDLNEKRKCTETDVHGDIEDLKIFEHIDLSDNVQDIVHKRLHQTIGHNKFLNNPTLEKPTHLEEWTSTTNLRGLEDKSNVMALSN